MLNTSRFSIRYRFVRIRYIYTYFFDTAPWSITTIPPITNCNSQSLQTKLKASPISTRPYSYLPLTASLLPTFELLSNKLQCLIECSPQRERADMEDLSRGDTEKFGGCLQNACEEFHG